MRLTQTDHVKHETEHLRTLTGAVKWFDPVRGFGFIVAEEGGSDILLHMNVLRNYGQSSVAEAAIIEVTVQDTTRGAQAVEVLSITLPEEQASHAPLEDVAHMDPVAVAQAPLQPGRVKWFDKGKGFGFANVFGRSDDVFLHIDVLRRSGLSDAQPGEALAMKVIDGTRGQMAAEVHAWEAALVKDLA